MLPVGGHKRCTFPYATENSCSFSFNKMYKLEVSTILVDLVSQHTFEVNMLGMKGINFMYMYFKCPWKITFEKKVLCSD